MKNLKASFAYLIFFSLVLFYPAAQENMPLHLKIMGRERATAPERVGEYIVFSYKGTGYTRYVAARFAHENYETLHVYELNQHDVFILAYPVPEEITRLKYRIIVDGVISADPYNDAVEEDISGIVFSVFPLQPVKEKTIINPEILGNQASFTVKSRSGRAVYLAGDFNNWDPYMYKLQETAPGIYRISLAMPRGIHYYYYLIDGIPIADMDNPGRRIDAYRRDVSVFVIE